MRERTRCLFVMCLACVAILSLSACNQKQEPSTASSSSSTNNAKPAGTATSGEIDACKLVTKAEAEQVMGEKLKDPDSGPASMQGGTICMYGSPDSLSGKHVSIRVESPRFDWVKYKEDRRVEGEKMQPRRGRIREVPGLGKEAYFARHTLHVLTDHGILTINIFKDPADAAAGEEKETKTEAAEKALADLAVKRMS